MLFQHYFVCNLILTIILLNAGGKTILCDI